MLNLKLTIVIVIMNCRGHNQMYRQAWIGICTEKSHTAILSILFNKRFYKIEDDFLTLLIILNIITICMYLMNL